MLLGNICALLAARNHVNIFLYDGAIVPDPEGIITAGHDNKTARTVAVREGETINATALAAMFNQIIAPGPDGARARSPALGAITRLPSWTPGLVLEYANLMAKKQYFRLKVGCGVSAIEEDVEEQAEEAVDQGQEHDSPSSQARPFAGLVCDRTFRTPPVVVACLVAGHDPASPRSG